MTLNPRKLTQTISPHVTDGWIDCIRADNSDVNRPAKASAANRAGLGRKILIEFAKIDKSYTLLVNVSSLSDPD